MTHKPWFDLLARIAPDEVNSRKCRTAPERRQRGTLLGSCARRHRGRAGGVLGSGAPSEIGRPAIR
jgi:hypothetical protein